MRKLRFRRNLLGLAVVIAALLLFTLHAKFLDRLALYGISQWSGCDIAYSKIYRDSRKMLAIENLSVFDQKRKIGIEASSAVLDADPLRMIFSPQEMRIPFELKGVSFQQPEGFGEKSQSPFEELISLPFQSRWNYSLIRGEVSVKNRTVFLNSFYAESATIKLKINGTLFANDELDVTIWLSFSPGIHEVLPEEIMSIFNEEEDGWKSITFELSGNYKKPSIQVQSKFFRLRLGM